VADFENDPVSERITLSIEEMIIFLRQRFTTEGDRETVLEFLSHVDLSAEAVFRDDGFSQEVTIKKEGIAGRKATVVPNPLSLCPFRTFPEIEQPSADYILRLSKGEASGQAHPKVTLIAVDDGGAWKMAAIQSIKEWLIDKLNEAVIVLA
jgi:hypothetical protein